MNTSKSQTRVQFKRLRVDQAVAIGAIARPIVRHYLFVTMAKGFLRTQLTWHEEADRVRGTFAAPSQKGEP
jgi:hypothetical protein